MGIVGLLVDRQVPMHGGRLGGGTEGRGVRKGELNNWLISEKMGKHKLAGLWLFCYKTTTATTTNSPVLMWLVFVVVVALFPQRRCWIRVEKRGSRQLAALLFVCLLFFPARVSIPSLPSQLMHVWVNYDSDICWVSLTR